MTTDFMRRYKVSYRPDYGERRRTCMVYAVDAGHAMKKVYDEKMTMVAYEERILDSPFSKDRLRGVYHMGDNFRDDIIAVAVGYHREKTDAGFYELVPDEM